MTSQQKGLLSCQSAYVDEEPERTPNRSTLSALVRDRKSLHPSRVVSALESALLFVIDVFRAGHRVIELLLGVCRCQKS
jgi:hypothetical protein